MAKQGDINKTIEEAVGDRNKTIPEPVAALGLFAGRYRKTHDRVGNNGGMGDVFVAEDTDLHNTKVVVKMLRLDGLRDPEGWKERFKREVEIARSLRGNDNIVPVFEYGECRENARPYMTMEYIDDAVDLATYVADKGGRLNEKEICEILKPIAEAIDFAHRPKGKRKAVVHRDIKPANILVQRTGGEVHPWILDFGISKSIDPTREHPDVTLTDIAGTVGYMPPEKLNGERRPHPAQDVYSFAVVLYECLMGRHPFVDSDGRLPTQAVLRDRIQAADFEHPGEPASYLAKMIVRGLSPKPEDRPKTCAEFFGRKEPGGGGSAGHGFSLAQSQFEWTGKPIVPVVLKDGKEIKGGQEYLIRCKNNVEVGEASVEIAGFAVSRVVLPFRIVPKSISRKGVVQVTKISPQAFTGECIMPSFRVMDNALGVGLQRHRDYTVVGLGSGNVGDGRIRIVGQGHYAGEIERSFEITPKDFGRSVSIDPIAAVEFNGKPQRPPLVVRDRDRNLQLQPRVDFVTRYSRKPIGDNTVEITGRGNYEGTTTILFTIKPRDISHATVSPIKDQVYEGRPLENVDVEVVDEALGCKLEPGTDYSVTCENAKIPGEGRACVRGLGNYSGKTYQPFRILKGQFRISMQSLSCRCEYDAQKHGIAVEANERPDGLRILYSLAQDGEYRAKKFSFREACERTPVWFRLECDGYEPYNGMGTVEILRRSIRELTVRSVSALAYGSPDAEPDIVLFDPKTGEELKRDMDFAVSPPVFNADGNGSVRLTGIGNYCDQRDVEFQIAKKDISSARVDPILPQVYDGQPRRPSVTVHDVELNRALVEGRDYSLTYGDRTEVGESRVQLAGQGNYCGEKTVVFQITPRDIAQAVVTVQGSVRYAGEPIRHVEVTVVDKSLDRVLKEGLDYSLDCESAEGPGKATVRIVGKGNYCGETRAAFEILPGQFKPPEVCGHDGEYDGAEHGIVVTPKNAPSGTEVEYALAEDGPYVPQTSTFRDVCDGTRVWFRLTHAGYEPWYGSASVTISPRPVGKLQVGKIPSQTFRGETVRPDVTVRDDTLGLLAQGRDYDLEYRDIDRPGTGFVVITGCGNYTGVREVEFVIRPPSRFGWKKAVWAAGCALLLAGVGVFGWQTWESAERQKQAEIQRQAKAARRKKLAKEEAERKRQAEEARQKKLAEEAVKRYGEEARKCEIEEKQQKAHAAFNEARGENLEGWNEGFKLAMELGKENLSNDWWVAYNVYLGYAPDDSHGDQTEKSWAKAYDWLNTAVTWKASQQDKTNGYVECAMGDLVLAGHGCAADAVQAVEWYEKATNSFPTACLKLAEIYEKGVANDDADKAVAQDLKKAYGLYEVAKASNVEWMQTLAEDGLKRLREAGYKPDGKYVETVDGIEWRYVIADGEATVGSGESNESAVAVTNTLSRVLVIPKRFGRHPVTSIGTFAFSGCSKLTSVTIPPLVTKIDYSAFYECLSLTSVSIPSSVTSIGADAFGACGNLKEVCVEPKDGERVRELLKKSGVDVDKLTFKEILGKVSESKANGRLEPKSSDCVDVGSGEEKLMKNRKADSKRGEYYVSEIEGIKWNYVVSDGKVFVGTGFVGDKAMPAFVGDVAGEVTIPCQLGGCSVVSISEFAFYGKTKLTSVTIPASVTSIGTFAFRGCSKLTSVTIPPLVTKIDCSAFYECLSLTSVSIPSSVTSIGADAFGACGNLKEVCVEPKDGERVRELLKKSGVDVDKLTFKEILGKVSESKANGRLEPKSSDCVDVGSGEEKVEEQADQMALTNDIGRAHDAFADKDFKTGFDIALKLGLDNISDSYVTYHVGYCYSPTYGTEYPSDKDYAKAYVWFCRTAKLEEDLENGDGITECILGDMELAGYGCASNLENAVNWYRRSAERGYWRGRCELGRCYERNLVGDGKDHLIEATNYYFQAMFSGGDSEATNAYQRVKEELNEKFTKDALLAFVEDRWPQGVELAMKTDLRDRRLRVLVGLCCFSGTGIEKNPTIAVRHIRAAADMGEPMAQTLLGTCYMYGNVPKNCKGLPVDLAEAIQWLQKAAAQGEPLAQCTLGLCYEEGKGVPADQDVAVSWFRKAAERGLPSAQAALGVRYVAGQGLPKNEKKGVMWIQKAVDQGCAQAMRDLANCYTRGLGVPKNLELAECWRKKAKKGKTGEDFTQEWIARWYKGIGAQKTACGCAHADKSSMKRAMELLEDGERYYWGRGVAQDDGRAMKCWRESSDLGLPLAHYKLATLYRDGRGCKQNAETAVALFQKAADAGITDARYWLGISLRDGKGCEKNPMLANQLLRQSVLEFREKAEKGDTEAQWSLGVALSYGIGCEKNEREAVMWWRKASENGNLVAQDQIGYLTENGEQGVAKDEKLAVSIYREAAEKGCAGAQYHLALAYLRGKGVEKNEELAFEWCEKAADAGLCEAQNKVGDMLSEGIGCVKNEKAAVKWWIKAARQDGHWISGAAMFKLDMKGVKWVDDEIPNADEK